jgi:hypothetical protein
MSVVSLTRAALLAVTVSLVAPAGGEAAPMPTNVAAMKAVVAQDAVQVLRRLRLWWGLQLRSVAILRWRLWL